MRVPVRDMSGKQVGELELSDAIFATPVNTSVMHQALVRQLSNARLGTHDTKTRGEVRGGGKKPWRQKGTGRARQGSTRAPNWVGGGTVFGPTPRKYVKALPKKMQRLALRCALSSRRPPVRSSWSTRWPSILPGLRRSSRCCLRWVSRTRLCCW